MAAITVLAIIILPMPTPLESIIIPIARAGPSLLCGRRNRDTGVSISLDIGRQAGRVAELAAAAAAAEAVLAVAAQATAA